MYLNIMGFLPDECEDDSLKYELDITPELEPAVMKILGWTSLAENCQGVFELSRQQARQISWVTHEHLPLELDLFIGVLRS